jgi:hypothetical protein
VLRLATRYDIQHTTPHTRVHRVDCTQYQAVGGRSTGFSLTKSMPIPITKKSLVTAGPLLSEAGETVGVTRLQSVDYARSLMTVVNFVRSSNSNFKQEGLPLEHGGTVYNARGGLVLILVASYLPLNRNSTHHLTVGKGRWRLFRRGSIKGISRLGTYSI